MGHLRGGSAEEDGGAGDKASNGEHASNNAAVKLRPDMPQDIFQQDEALAHIAAKTKRCCEDNFPDLWVRVYDPAAAQTHRKPFGDRPEQGRQDEPGDVRTLIENSRSVWCCFSAEMLDNVMCGMPEHMAL